MPATSDLKDVIIAYKKLSFSDQAAFYAMGPNDFCLTNSDIQSFLIAPFSSAIQMHTTAKP